MEINQTRIPRSRIIISSLAILGVVVIGLVFMFWGDGDRDGKNSDSFFGILFNQEKTPAGSDPLQGGIIIGEDSGEEEKEITLYQISTEPVVGATLSPDGSRVRYFKQASGHLYENEFAGAKEIRISNITIPAILKVDWTHSKTYAIISYYADGAIRRLYSHYSGTSTASSAFLPPNIQEITTSQTDDMITYTVLTNGEPILFVARPDNTNARKILALPAPDFELSWPVANNIALKQKSSAYTSSFLFTLNPASKLLTRVLTQKEGLDVSWAPDGSKFLSLETKNEGTRALLSVVSLKDNNVVALPFTTLPEKCAWAPASKNTIFCAIPDSIPRGTNLPDEWWQGMMSFNDAVGYINMETGEQTQLLPTRQLDAVNLFLSKDESFLFFTNKKNGSLWSLKLKSQNL